MRELRPVAWCDQCYATRHAFVPSASEHTITIARHTLSGAALPTKPRRIDLCEDCEAALLLKVRELLDEHGRDPKDSRSTPTLQRTSPAPIAAPVGDADTAAAQTPPPTWGKRRWKCPICGEERALSTAATHVYGQHVKAEPALFTVCPECRLSFDGSQQAAVHRVRAHGWSRLDDALAAAGVTS